VREAKNPLGNFGIFPSAMSVSWYKTYTYGLQGKRISNGPYDDYDTVFGLIYVGSFVLGYGHCRGEDTNIAEGGICVRERV